MTEKSHFISSCNFFPRWTSSRVSNDEQNGLILNSSFFYFLFLFFFSPVEVLIGKATIKRHEDRWAKWNATVFLKPLSRFLIPAKMGSLMLSRVPSHNWKALDITQQKTQGGVWRLKEEGQLPKDLGFCFSFMCFQTVSELESLQPRTAKCQRLA